MSKKVSIGALITLMAVTAALTFSMTIVYYELVFNDKMSNLQAREAMYNKLSQVDQLFRNNYAGQIDENLLRDMLATGYVRGTGDTYARYYTAEAYKRELAAQAGRVMSVGVVTEKDPSGYLVITDVYSGSAAETAELKKGDLIVAMDGVEIKAENATQMQEQLQGEAGTKITLTVRRDSEDKDFPITRRYVDIPSVFSRMLAGNIGYLRISNISDTTDEQFNKQLERLITQNATAVILDLRNTADGITESAIHILDRMLPAGVAVTATYKDNSEKVFEMTDAKELTLPVVILTNEKTAREAEIIAQVMKDYGRARIVGTKTAGKGSRQEFRSPEGSDGSAVLLTVALYKTSKGETFNLTGVKPDYEVALTAEEEKNFANLDETTDPQLKKAIEVTQGLIRAVEESTTSSSNEVVATSSTASVEVEQSSASESEAESEASSGSDTESSSEQSESSESSSNAE